MASYNKSYDKVLDNLLELANKSIPGFTNYQDDDPAVILIKLISMLSVSTNMYSNKYLSSRYLQQSSSVDPRSMYTLLESFDKIPNPSIPGEIDVVFEYSGPNLEEQMVIPKGIQVDVGGVEFTTFEDYYMKPLNTFIDINLIEGTYKTEEFKGSSIHNGRLILDSPSVSINHVSVIVDGNRYSKVENSEYLLQTGVFSIKYSVDQEYEIIFSKNYSELINNSSRIIVNYIESSGEVDYDPLEQNIKIDSEITYNGSDVSSLFRVYVITGYKYGDVSRTEVTNYENLSNLLSTFGKAITTEDYENLTNNYPGVAISAAYDINSVGRLDPDISIMTPFLTKIVVAPQVGYYATKTLKDELYKYLREVGISEEDLYLELMDPKYVVIDLTIGIKSTNVRQSDLLNTYSNVSSAIKDYFRIGNIKFRSFISKDYISNLVAKSDDSIIYVDLLDFMGYQLEANELPILGRLNILFSYNSLILTDQIELSDNVKYVEATHKFTGGRGENIITRDRLPDNAIRLEPSDHIESSDYLFFGRESEFELGLSQKSVVRSHDNFSKSSTYATSAKSVVYTVYDIDSTLDDDMSEDDLKRHIPEALVTDRIYAYRRDYMF